MSTNTLALWLGGVIGFAFGFLPGYYWGDMHGRRDVVVVQQGGIPDEAIESRVTSRPREIISLPPPTVWPTIDPIQEYPLSHFLGDKSEMTTLQASAKVQEGVGLTVADTGEVIDVRRSSPPGTCEVFVKCGDHRMYVKMSAEEGLKFNVGDRMQVRGMVTNVQEHYVDCDPISVVVEQ